MRGTLILVVGPSGVGKDSIIAGAAERFRRDKRIVFARRVITRSAVAGGEDHVAVSPAQFAEWRAAGQLMLHWQAHGLDYGLPGELAEALEAGRTVIANVSREIVGAARLRFAPVAVVAVSASPATLAIRLAERGRESGAEIVGRLERIGALPPEQADIVIENDGPLDAAVARFIALVRDYACATGGTAPCGFPGERG